MNTHPLNHLTWYKTLFETQNNPSLHKPSKYVDKTMFIKAVLEDTSKKIIIYSPKYMQNHDNVIMLKRFVEIEVKKNEHRSNLLRDEDENLLEYQPESNNLRLFKDKEIFTFEKNGFWIFNQEFFTNHFGRYPTIFLDFELMHGITYEECLYFLGVAVCFAFYEHKYLINSRIWEKYSIDQFSEYLDYMTPLTESQIIDGLGFLSDLLTDHFKDDKKVYLIINNYDDVIYNLLFEHPLPYHDFQRISSIIEAMTGAILNHPNIERAFLSGHFDIEGIPLPDNVKHYSFLEDNQYSKFYNTTHTEMNYFKHKVGISNELTIVKQKFISEYFNIKPSKNILSSPKPTSYGIQSTVTPSFSTYHSPLIHLLCYKNISKKIEFLLENKFITIKYKKRLDMDDFITLRKLSRSESIETNEIGDVESDLLIQMLYETGWLKKKSLIHSSLTLEIPDEICSKAIKVSYDIIIPTQKQELLFNFFFADGIGYFMRSKNKDTLANVANGIQILFGTHKLATNEFQFFDYILYALKNKSKYTRGECFTSRNRRTTAVITTIAKDRVAVMMELYISHQQRSALTFRRIIDDKYHEMIDEDIEDRIYMDITLNKKKQKVYISYLINSLDISKAKTVRSH